MAVTLLPPPPVENDREVLAALAAACAHRQLVYSLTMTDLRRWDDLTEGERRIALARARRRVQAVAPQAAFAF